MSASYEIRKALFEEMHRLNPHIYSEIVARARRAKERGAHIGIRCIWEAIRYDWSVAVRHEENTPRLNDWATSFYARLIDQQEPDLKNYFELRDRPSRPSESEAA